jgi:hypothetical protein
MMFPTCNRSLRQAIRNAWFPEPLEAIKAEAENRAAQGKWFEVTVLLELALEVATENG